METHVTRSRHSAIDAVASAVDADLLRRVRTTSIVLGLVLAAPFAFYCGLGAATGWILGGAWSLVNLGAIAAVVRRVVTNEPRSRGSVATALMVKFPLLYAAAIGMLAVGVPAAWFLAGFTWPLFVAVMKAAGRSYLKLDESASRLETTMESLLIKLNALLYGVGALRLAAEPAADGGHDAPHELPNLITLVTHFMHDSPLARFLHEWEGMIWALSIATLIIVVARLAARNPQMVPGRLQNVVEMVVEGLSNFIVGILGPQGREFVPFLGSLFIYILAMNLAGAFPLGKSPTASPNTTVALALCVFFYVHYIGLTRNGPVGYVRHLAGNPKSLVEWAFVPLMLPIHIIGEIARPVSLSLRLFGNVTGEDVLLFAFCSLGVTTLAFVDSPVGIPFQIPFILLAFMTSFIQALVFTLLSTIYILLWLPHEEHAEAGHH
jgi:F-type H+-transporting ATPase subunit a